MKFVRDVIAPLITAVAIFALFQITLGTFKVYGSSMEPSIQPGEYIVVRKTAYFLHTPERGDIIVFHSPQSPDSDLIKRVIALPGDTIEIKNGTVFVNDIPILETYAAELCKNDYHCQEIPANNYFVLGDNRNHSADSRRGWTVPDENIVGRSWLTYWPPEKWGLFDR